MAEIHAPITKDAAAQLLSVTKRTIENWIAQGILPPPRAIGRRVYWPETQFDAWLTSCLGDVSSARVGEGNLSKPQGDGEQPRRGRKRTPFVFKGQPRE